MGCRRRETHTFRHLLPVPNCPFKLCANFRPLSPGGDDSTTQKAKHLKITGLRYGGGAGQQCCSRGFRLEIKSYEANAVGIAHRRSADGPPGPRRAAAVTPD
jgi:hypothetical protein